MDNDCHLSAEIVTDHSKEFDFSELEAMETNLMSVIDQSNDVKVCTYLSFGNDENSSTSLLVRHISFGKVLNMGCDNVFLKRFCSRIILSSIQAYQRKRKVSYVGGRNQKRIKQMTPL